MDKGVGGEPTIVFSGVNVQIVNGKGKTESANGRGNLVLGYDEDPGEQTGSHDLAIGTALKFTRWGGIVSGYGNSITGAFSSVTGGAANSAEGEGSTVSGGYKNTTEAAHASIFGGKELTAKNEYEYLP